MSFHTLHTKLIFLCSQWLDRWSLVNRWSFPHCDFQASQIDSIERLTRSQPPRPDPNLLARTFGAHHGAGKIDPTKYQPTNLTQSGDMRNTRQGTQMPTKMRLPLYNKPWRQWGLSNKPMRSIVGSRNTYVKKLKLSKSVFRKKPELSKHIKGKRLESNKNASERKPNLIKSASWGKWKLPEKMMEETARVNEEL